MEDAFRKSLASQIEKYADLNSFVNCMHLNGHSFEMYRLYTEIIQANCDSETPKEVLAQVFKDNISIISSEICTHINSKTCH